MISKNDLFGRIIGFSVFLVGISVLSFVGIMAYKFFTTPARDLMFSSSQDLGKSILLLVIKMLMLLLITAVGSLIAGKGVQFYHAALHPKSDDGN